MHTYVSAAFEAFGLATHLRLLPSEDYQLTLQLDLSWLRHLIFNAVCLFVTIATAVPTTHQCWNSTAA